MSIEIITSPTYDKQRRKGSASPCIICGKGVTNPRYMVHVHYGGGHVVTEAEAAELNRPGSGWEGGDLYFYPIGADCLRRHPEYRPYVHDMSRADDPDGTLAVPGFGTVSS